MTARPEIARPAPWAFPTPIDRRLDNGLRVLAFDRPGQHVVTVAVSVDLPLGTEPAALEGVATLVQRTLDEGTHDHPGATFAEAMESIGAGLDGHVGQAQSVLFLTVTASRLAPALALLAEALRTPAFAAADIERHRRLRLAELDQVAAYPAQRAEIAFRHLALHPLSRAARLAGGSAETVSAVAPDDIAAFHAASYRPAVTTVVLAGAFTTDPIALVEQHFGTWAGDDTAPIHPPARPGPGGVVLVDRPGSVHADVRLGGFSIDRSDARWAPLRLATHIVGGEFLSRLNRVLREQRGYTYGVSMAQRPLRSGGTYAVRGSFRSEVVAPALAEARDILRVDAFTEREVAQAADFFAGSSALRFATAAGIAGEVSTMLAAGLGPAAIDDLLARYGQVTPATALAAYREVVLPDELTLAVVGAADALADPLRAAGFPVTVVSADEPIR
ncbi:M16 family metallopeptidase [Propionicicella superfundia]|uniref:M16 family metallopeptidase n=1 Tax=Propionicicella superfundia TaxID=348582 RepID=UPI000424149A|nr:pitrilysin family protein [Propionicicella superfundia]